MQRFTKRQGVLARLLGVVTSLPFDMTDEVQPSAEVRAMRYWEEFDERIIRFWASQVVPAAGAGTFSALAVNLNAGFASYPAGTLVCVDRMKLLTGGLILDVYAGIVGFTQGAVGNWFYKDSRWGGQGNALGNFTLAMGSLAALAPAACMWRLGNLADDADDAAYVMGLNDALLLVCNTANTAFTCAVSGRIILPR